MKILASDFDNTLYFYDGQRDYYHQADIQAIKKFQQAGNLFGLCTGRNYKGVTNYNYHHIRYDFFILCSGAKILDQNGEVIFQKFIPAKLVKEIIKDYSNVDTSGVDKGEMYFLNHHDPVNKNHRLITSLDEVSDNLEAFSLHLDNEEMAYQESLKIKEKYGDVIAVYQNERHLDFAPLGCSKGAGILKIIEYFKVDNQDMAVIGDSYNDLPMFAVVDQAFTFNRSPEKVKQAAKYLVDGIDECIEKLLEQE